MKHIERSFGRQVSRGAQSALILLCWALATVPGVAQPTSPFATGSQPISVSATTGAATVAPVAVASWPAGLLTDEELDFMRRFLLPANYPSLKVCMLATPGAAGVTKAKELARSEYPNSKGHFSTGFGDPVKMLAWARYYTKDEKMVRFVASMRRGDIILIGPQSSAGIKENPICRLTKGAYYHAVMVVDGPPGNLIEAVGITGQRSDPAKDKVRYSSWFEGLGSWAGMRLLRPAARLGQPAAGKAIEAAIHYAEAQLGKPYDYSFSDNDGNRAFYCSELVYKAYHDGASFTELLPNRSTEKDRIVIALHAVVDGLQPKDRFALSNKVVNFSSDYIKTQPPDVKKLFNFIVDEVVPDCKVFAKAFPDKAARERLRTVLNKIPDNKAFPKYLEAQKNFYAAEKAGDFKAGWGVGRLRKLAAEAKIGLGIAADVNAMMNETGAKKTDLLMLIGRVIAPIYKNLGTYSETLTGMNRDKSIALPDGVQTVCGMVDWATKKREQARNIPLIGDFVASLLPGNGDDKKTSNFTSPSSLVDSSPDFHVDYP